MCGCLGFREKLLFLEAAVLAYGSKNRKVRGGGARKSRGNFCFDRSGRGKEAESACE